MIDANSDVESNIFSSSSPDILNSIEDTQSNKVILEDCSVTYFSGYFAYMCDKQFNCNHCPNILQTNQNLSDKNQLLLINKNYSSFKNDIGLKALSIFFNKIINCLLDIFEKHFEKIQHKKNFDLN